MSKSIHQLRKEALLYYWKHQGLVGLKLYRRVIISLKELESLKDIKWNARS